MDIDRLNNLESISWKRRSEPYDTYFGDMELTEDQKEERKKYAEEFEDIFLFVMLLWLTQRQYGGMDYEHIRTVLADEYGVVLSSLFADSIDPYAAGTGDYMTMEDYIAEKSEMVAEDFVRTTRENVEDPYYLSLDRAMFIAENEANGNVNYKDFLKAIDKGKRYKEWVTMRDRRVRKTHSEVDGRTIPIVKLFNVGNSQMLYPKDTLHGASAEEVVGCRCSVQYK